MTVSYLNFMKAAANVTKKVSDSRPVLKGVYHKKNGELIVTDSHRLYELENSGLALDDVVVDPVTGAEIDGSYPDTSRLIPEDKDAKEVYTFNIDKEVVKRIDSLNKIANLEDGDTDLPHFKGTSISMFTLTGGAINNVLGKHRVVGFSYPLGIKQKTVDHPVSVTVNSQFFYDAIKMFYDLYSLQKYNEIKLTLFVYSELRPVLLKFEDLTALILPIRHIY